MYLVLASKSPRRRELLLQAGYQFQINVKNINEAVEETNPVDKILSIAKKKGIDVFSKYNNEEAVIKAIVPEKDVDGFSAINVGRLYQGKDEIVPCTPKGVLTILKELEPELKGKNAVVVGRSQIVGKPMAALLLNENMTVTICHSATTNLPEHTRMADVLVVATGIPHLIKDNMVKEGAIVIDVGMTRVKDKLVGDVDTENVDKVAKFVTPVPGGVEPMTIAMLMHNIVKAVKMQKN